MREVFGHLPPGGAVDEDAFADLTAVPVESVTWARDGRLRVLFADHIPAATIAAVARRIVSKTPREERLRAVADDYLTNPEPTLSEMREQVIRLTEIVLGKSET